MTSLANITFNGHEMQPLSAARTKMSCRWRCLRCETSFGMKVLAAYSTSPVGGSVSLCRACVASLPGNTAASSAPVAASSNVSRRNSQSGGSVTDVAEDCGHDREFGERGGQEIYGGEG